MHKITHKYLILSNLNHETQKQLYHFYTLPLFY